MSRTKIHDPRLFGVELSRARIHDPSLFGVGLSRARIHDPSLFGVGLSDTTQVGLSRARKSVWCAAVR